MQVQFRRFHSQDGKFFPDPLGTMVNLVDGALLIGDRRPPIVQDTVPHLAIPQNSDGYANKGLWITHDSDEHRVNIHFGTESGGPQLYLTEFNDTGVTPLGVLGKDIGPDGQYFVKEIPPGGGLRITNRDVGQIGTDASIVCLDIVDSREPTSQNLRISKEKYGFYIPEQKTGEGNQRTHNLLL